MSKGFFKIAIIVVILTPAVTVLIIETQYRPDSSAFTFIISDNNNQKLEVTSSYYYDQETIKNLLESEINLLVVGSVEEYANEYGCRYVPGTVRIAQPSLFRGWSYDIASSFDELYSYIGIDECRVYDIDIRASYNVFEDKWIKFTQFSNNQVMGMTLGAVCFVFGLIAGGKLLLIKSKRNQKLAESIPSEKSCKLEPTT